MKFRPVLKSTIFDLVRSAILAAWFRLLVIFLLGYKCPLCKWYLRLWVIIFTNRTIISMFEISIFQLVLVPFERLSLILIGSAFSLSQIDVYFRFIFLVLSSGPLLIMPPSQIVHLPSCMQTFKSSKGPAPLPFLSTISMAYKLVKCLHLLFWTLLARRSWLFGCWCRKPIGKSCWACRFQSGVWWWMSPLQYFFQVLDLRPHEFGS